jgi:hypothetical protein
MKLVDTTTEETGRSYGTRKELYPTEKWLFDLENGEIRLFTLLKMPKTHYAIAEVNEFKDYGNEIERNFDLNNSLNRTFLRGNLPLIATGEKDSFVIRKLQESTILNCFYERRIR